MPEKQDKLNFDFNQFTRDILGITYHQSFVIDINSLYDAHTNGVPVSKMDEETILKNIEFYKRNKEEEKARVLDIIYKLYSNPNIEGATEFYNYWNLIRGILSSDDIYRGTHTKLNRQDILLVLNKLSVFDEETRLAILKYAAQLEELTKEDKQKIQVQIASNKSASSQDKARAAWETLKPEIISDAISALKKDLETELNKDFPNPKNVDTICYFAHSIASYIHNEKFNDRQYSKEHPSEIAVLKDYYDMIKSEFDTNKILELGSEYIPQLNQSLEERAIQAEQRAKNAEQRAKEAEQRAKNAEDSRQFAFDDREKAQQDLRKEQQKNAQFANEMTRMQAELNHQGAFIKALKMKMATLKMGVFGNGKEFQSWLEQKISEFAQPQY